ncbi:MAG: hypothetical protein RL367_2086 [Pseudomonadota bacterium]
MKLDRRKALTLLSATPFAVGATRPDEVTIFEASKIITMEPSLPTARFAAVAGGIILGVAETQAALEPWTRGRSVVVDQRFARRILMPGFIDPHVHPVQAAVMLNLPFLAPDDWTLPTGIYPGVRTAPAYKQRLADMLGKSAARPFIIWGYH